MEIKNLVFDLGGVILEDSFATASAKIAPLYNIEENELTRVFRKHNLDIYQNGQSTYKDRLIATLTELNRLDIDVDPLIKIIQEIFQPVPGMIELLQQSKESYVLYMLSNQTAATLPYLEDKYEFFNYFKYSVFSYRVGLAKPHKEIFEYFLKNTGIKPQESIFIDNLEDNLVTAKQLGFNTILFENEKQLQNDINIILTSNNKIYGIKL